MFTSSIRLIVSGWLVLAGTAAWSQAQPAEGDAKETPKANEAASDEPLPALKPIPDETLVPTLPTTPVRRGASRYNHQMVDASLLPRDKAGIWVLDFTFKPVRLITVDIPGKGRKTFHYLYYRVINHTGQPRRFVPQFSLVTDTGKRYEDTVLPQGVKNIEAREDPSIHLLGAVDIMGVIPPSKKEGIDDAVYGVAIWDAVDPHADRFSIYVRGLSDGQQALATPDGKETIRYKTLRIDFIRRGDDRNLNEKEIQLFDPPYEWLYW
ncbi:hypothetical protein [Singulisphaera sp. PoT]|uniref:hypothetical protein n=1 Tax=Singulisphaera sp. PoT TaxID=3411797 RepID=UPI003BF4B528